ncbi:MAG: hypothetical protein ABL996_18870 [Micropepsaceae bacterium]
MRHRYVFDRLALAAIFASSLLASLASPAAFARNLPSIKTVGVVSDVGDKIRLQHIGFMVFSNKLTEGDFPEWGIDAHITSQLEAGLKERYELRAVDFPKGKIAPDLDDIGLFEGPRPEKNMRVNAKPANGEPIDAYLVVWQSSREVYPTNQHVQGLGLLTQASRARTYIAITVTLLDGKTFEEIDTCAARVRPVSFGDPDGSYMNVTPELFAESFDAMTPEQKKALEEGLKKMLNDGLAYCLHDLKLVP